MWRSNASLSLLKKRAELFRQIREFFHARGYLEVETPLLSRYTVTSPFIQSFSVPYEAVPCEVIPGEAERKTAYLQTSPEYHMKRLLASGIGPIFQITKAFRAAENGRFHNPEFTMLEWYRPGFTHIELMEEMSEFLQRFFGKTKSPQKITYRKLFLDILECDPFDISIEEIQRLASRHHLDNISGMERASVTDWLQLFMTHLIEPRLPQDHPTFIYDFPPEQAALAKIRRHRNGTTEPLPPKISNGPPHEPPVAERFEVYFKGVELANGFHELADPIEQRKRFEEDNLARQKMGLPRLPIDENLIEALSHNFP